MHSHILPGIDDGAADVDTSLELIRGLMELGYKSFTASPHVIGDFYRNNDTTIDEALRTLREGLMLAGIEVEVDAIAEYFLDDYFLNEVLPRGLRSFADKQVLVEVSMAGWPRNFSDLLFSVQAEGYTPVLAHPERYEYEADLKVFEALREKGVLMQMNLLAATGYYGRGVQAMAQRMMEAKLYTYCGSDAHHARHIANYGRLLREHPDTMARLEAYGFRNSDLLTSRRGGPAELG